jgi:hypothetical protein
MIDGDELLEKIRQWLATHICTVTDADLDLLTLWAAHTHLVVETYTTPRRRFPAVARPHVLSICTG